MTIEEVKREKRLLEQSIYDAITGFEKRTKLSVAACDLTHNFVLGPGLKLADVRVKVELP